MGYLEAFYHDLMKVVNGQWFACWKLWLQQPSMLSAAWTYVMPPNARVLKRYKN